MVAGATAGEAAIVGFRGDRDNLRKAESSNYGGTRTGSQKVFWSLEGTDAVALTFDDGPTPRFTPRVLDLLDGIEARATFFFIGRNVDANPDLAREVVKRGHEIANHTWSHPSLAVKDEPATRREIERGAEVIAATTGVSPAWFRPPRGQLTGSALHHTARLGEQVAMWSVTRGGSQIGDDDHDAVARHLLERIESGSIVDLHDGLGRAGFSPRSSMARKVARRREAEMRALPDVLAELRRRGTRFVTLSEAPGVSTVDMG